MADIALRINRDGSRTIVFAKDLTEKDRNSTFICAGYCKYGKYKGEPCETNVRPFICANRDNYFAATNEKHNRGCEYNESTKTVKVGCLCEGCEGKTDADIFENLRGHNRNGEGPAEPPRGGGGVRGGGRNEDDDNDEDNTIIERVPRDPRNSNELYDIFTELTPDEPFADKPVSEWIIDWRTFDRYYSDGITDGQICMAVLRKTHLPKELEKYKSDYYILAAIKKNQFIYFLIPKCQQVGELLSKDSNIISFAVIAKWHAVPNFPHAYYSKEEPEKRMITMRPNKEAKARFDKNKRNGDNS